MESVTWTVRTCLDWSCHYLESKGEERPRLAAEWLLSAVTGLERIQLYINFDRPMAKEELAHMHDALVRRVKGEPLQYITGETGFRGLDITCAPGVLIPRPETEMLVELVLDHLDRTVLGPVAPRRTRVELPWNDAVTEAREAARREAAELAAEEAADRAALEGDASWEPTGDADAEIRSARALDANEDVPAEGAAADGETPAGPAAPARQARVLEVGCGTGCIALSIAAERAGRVSCVATDIEPRAIELARRNRERAGLDAQAVDLRLGDLVAPVTPQEYGTFDVLVSNPPYIPSSVMARLPREVAAFEPALALDGGADGLDVYRRLLAAAPAMLVPRGLLACELFEGALERAAELARAAGFTDVRVVHDLTNRPRFVLACAPGGAAPAATEGSAPAPDPAPFGPCPAPDPAPAA